MPALQIFMAFLKARPNVEAGKSAIRKGRNLC
jgi:hypothetical protein